MKMRKLISIMLIIAGTTVAFASEPETKNSAPKAAVGMIKGKIVDSATGEALPGVCLKLIGGEQTTFSDLEGKFRMSELMPGNYEILINYVSYKDVTLSEIPASGNDLVLKVELEPVTSKDF
jgi:FlaG/FlaF family flagellin (archaellin)